MPRSTNSEARLRQLVAAINVDALTGYVAGIVGREQRHGVPDIDRLQLLIEPVVLSYSLSSQFDQIGIVIVGLLSYQSLCDLDTHRGNQP